MDEVELRNWINREGNSQFSRSGGPGGQNVNKVNTKVTLRLPLADIPLTPEERKLIHENLSGRINNAGELVGTATETRSQLRNRQIAEEKLYSWITAALRKQRKRTPTFPGRGAREKRIRLKKERGEIKKLRKGIPD